MLRDAGFEQVVVEQKPDSAAYIKQWLPGSGAEKHVVSANVTAVKPATLHGGGAAAAKRCDDAAKKVAAAPPEMPSRMKAALAKQEAAKSC